MPHTIYDNFYLSNEIEDQFDSKLDLQNFCTVDNSLVGTPGMLRKIHVYSATDSTQKLTMGNGNTQSIDVSYAEREYRIALAQNRFEYYDEQEMTDDMLIPTGTQRMASGMFNTVNADVYGEFLKAPQVVVATNIDFDAFVDAESVLELENLEDVQLFAFVSPKDMADIRKKLKDSLQYVERFVAQGYVGTVGGCNIYTKKDAKSGTVVLGTKEAVTIFNKKGIEVEQERDGNIRKNTMYSRKYYIVALTDETKAVQIIKGSAALSTDTSVDDDKTYYEANGNGYIAVVPKSTDNPSTEGWYEITPA